MLAAVPHEDKQLDTVRLILGQIAHQRDVPESLKRHLVEVITQAVRLADHLRTDGVVNGEAVELAVDISGDDLARDLRVVTDFASISPDLASRLLTKLQSQAA